jgi:hypothetical protein
MSAPNGHQCGVWDPGASAEAAKPKQKKEKKERKELFIDRILFRKKEKSY